MLVLQGDGGDVTKTPILCPSCIHHLHPHSYSYSQDGHSSAVGQQLYPKQYEAADRGDVAARDSDSENYIPPGSDWESANKTVATLGCRIAPIAWQIHATRECAALSRYMCVNFFQVTWQQGAEYFRL